MFLQKKYINQLNQGFFIRTFAMIKPDAIINMGKIINII